MSKIDKTKVKDDVIYAVDLNRPVQVGRSWVRPGETPMLKGKVIKENLDAVDAVANA